MALIGPDYILAKGRRNKPGVRKLRRMKFHLAFLSIPILCFSIGAIAAKGADRGTLDHLTALLSLPKYEGHRAANYCIADFDMDGKIDHAFGTVTDSPAFGTYFVQLGGRVIELAHHAAHSELQCLDAEKARKLNDALAASEGIHGNIDSGGPGDIVCGFVEITKVVCWKFDRSKDGFIVVGGWIT